MSELDAAALDRLRRSGLRLDGEGRWWHEGQPVEHPGLARALHRWLDRLDDGRHIVRLDGERFAYVEVDDAPYTVRSLQARDDGSCVLVLSDGSQEPLLASTVCVGADNALYCAVKGGRFEARLSRPAHYGLAEHVEQEEEGGYVLVLQGRRWPITRRRPR